jgi:hypothetical protein
MVDQHDIRRARLRVLRQEAPAAYRRDAEEVAAECINRVSGKGEFIGILEAIESR